MDFHDNKGGSRCLFSGTSASRVHPGLDSLGTMGLQSAWVCRAHPVLYSIEAIGRKASADTTGGILGQVGVPMVMVYLVDRLPRH